MRASPESTTNRTPSMVMEVSATFVATMIRGAGPGSIAARCRSGGRAL